MTRTRMTLLAASAASAAALIVAAGITPALADPLPYGPDTCINGYVWREARTGDTVCVTPATRSQVKQQNANPTANKEPGGGAYGPDTCMQGFVWREAFDGDTICVTPDIRSATLADNAAAESRKAANSPQPTPTPMTTSTTRPQAGGTVVFEVTGSGEVFSIDTDPAGSSVPDHTKLPFKRTMTIGSDVHLLQVVAVGRDDPGPGCRITLNGTVVAEQPVGGNAHCIFSLPD